MTYGTQSQNGAAHNGHDEGGERLARAMGIFSLGLGVVQIVAPGRLARAIGIEDADGTRAMMRAVGVREIASGVGLLSRPRPAGWMSARLAGDAMDLTLLGVAMGTNAESPARVAAAMATVAGITVPDLIGSARLAAADGQAERPVDVKAAITVRHPREELYRFWHNFENLPRFMYHLESVEVTGELRSHWRAKAPMGRHVSWDAETTDDRPGELISWRSLPGADVENSGIVRFTDAPGNRGTEVHVEIHYEPPAGTVSIVLAKLLGEEPTQQVKDDLRRLKQVLETGEVVRSEGTPEGIHAGRLLRQRPARPLASGRSAS
ncbi:MAG: hypothetical protein QOJ13_3013 [Gaiellales bacterium]|jgi:uncharacterized membrane protein|nr:hypothetical protein [Gaiellales bacterium]